MGSSGGTAFHETSFRCASRRLGRWTDWQTDRQTNERTGWECGVLILESLTWRKGWECWRLGISYVTKRRHTGEQQHEKEKPVRQHRCRRVPGGILMRLRCIRDACMASKRSADHRRAAWPPRPLETLLQIATESPGVRCASALLRRLQMGLRPVYRGLFRDPWLLIASWVTRRQAIKGTMSSFLITSPSTSVLHKLPANCRQVITVLHMSDVGVNRERPRAKNSMLLERW